MKSEQQKMKKILKRYCILSLVLFYCSWIFSRDTNVKKIKSDINVNYITTPFFVDFGTKYRNNNYEIFPYIGLSLDLVSQGTLLAKVGMDLKKNNFFTKMLVIQQILPPLFGNNFSQNDFKTMETYGSVVIGYDFRALHIAVDSRVGMFRGIEKGRVNMESNLHSLVMGIKGHVYLHLLIMHDFLNKINATLWNTFHFIPIVKQYSVAVDFRLPMSFLVASGWLELNVLNNIFYTDYFFNSQATYNIDRVPMSHSIRLGASKTVYQFYYFTEFEARLYIAAIPNSGSRFYFSAFATVGYGVEREILPHQGKLFYMFGGGIGYNVFDSVPLQLQVGMDNKKNFLFNVTFMSAVNFPT